MTPSFIYFDLGNVLLHYDEELVSRQLADVAGTSVERIKEVVFNGLAAPFERGELDSQQFYEIFCEQTGTQPEYSALKRAASTVFELNVRLVPLVSAMQRAGYRLGILSNTNRMHWKYISSGRYGTIPAVFERLALSFEIGALKPEREIYTAAAEIAGVAPEEIFFTDDKPVNVEGARAAGYDALVFTSPSELATELRQRGLVFNY